MSTPRKLKFLQNTFGNWEVHPVSMSAAPSNFTASIIYSSSGHFNQTSSNQFIFRVGSYKNVCSTSVYALTDFFIYNEGGSPNNNYYLNLTWSAVPDSDGYKLFISRDDFNHYTSSFLLINSSSTSINYGNGLDYSASIENPLITGPASFGPDYILSSSGDSFLSGTFTGERLKARHNVLVGTDVETTRVGNGSGVGLDVQGPVVLGSGSAGSLYSRYVTTIVGNDSQTPLTLFGGKGTLKLVKQNLGPSVAFSLADPNGTVDGGLHISTTTSAENNPTPWVDRFILDNVTGNISASIITASLEGTSSWANKSISSSYVLTSSFSLSSGNSGTTLQTGSTYQITSSQSVSASFASSVVNAITINNTNLTGQITASNISASYIQTVNPVDDQQVATKRYVDTIAGGFGVDYYFRSASSDLSPYNAMSTLSVPLSSSVTTLSVTSVSASQYIFIFASPVINTTYLQQGDIDFDYGIYYSGAGALASVVQELYLRSASVETLLGITPATNLTLNSTDTYTSTIILTSSLTTNLTDRLVLKFKVNSATLTPTVFLKIENNTGAGMTVPVPSINFISKTGDTMTGGLTAPSFTGSLLGTSSFALNSSATTLFTGSTYQITSSLATSAISSSFSNTASFVSSTNIVGTVTSASYSISASYSVSSSAAITASSALSASNLALFNFNNTSSILNSKLTASSIISVSTSSYNAAFFDYVVISASNVRAGTIFGSWTSSGLISYTEISHTDIGNTLDVTMSLGLGLGGVAQLSASCTTFIPWTIKAIGRYI